LRGFSLPADGSKTDFRNIVLHLRLNDGENLPKKEDKSINPYTTAGEQTFSKKPSILKNQSSAVHENPSPFLVKKKNVECEHFTTFRHLALSKIRHVLPTLKQNIFF